MNYGVIILLIAIVGSVAAQPKAQKGEFAGAQVVRVISECRGGDDMRLRIFNDTKWAISVKTFSMYVHPTRYRKYELSTKKTVFLLPNDRPISSLFYEVDLEYSTNGKGQTEQILRSGDSSSTSWVGPNESVFFFAPLRYLEGDHTLFVYFNYEWETTESGSISLNAPNHRAVLVSSGKPLPICSKDEQ